MATAHDPKDPFSELTEEERSRIKDMGDSFVITLLDPITYLHGRVEGERTLRELTITKKVKGKHLKKLDHVKGEMSQGLALQASLAGVPVQAMDELGVLDMDLINAVIAPFLPKSHRTGRD